MKNNKYLLPTNKKFGLFFSSVFLVLFIYFIYNFSLILFSIFGFLSLITLFLTLFLPNLLSPFNKFWFRIGLILNKIVSPLILGFIFFILISPFAIIMRFFKRDELKIKKPKNITYWQIRESNKNLNNNFKNQF